MSTKNLEATVEAYRRGAVLELGTSSDALEELDAIRKAARVITAHEAGEPYDGKELSEARELLASIAQEAER